MGVQDTNLNPTAFCMALQKKLEPIEKEGKLTAGEIERAVKEMARDSAGRLEELAKDLKTFNHVATRATKLLLHCLHEDHPERKYLLGELADIYLTASWQPATLNQAKELNALGEALINMPEIQVLSRSTRSSVRIGRDIFGALTEKSRTTESAEAERVSLVKSILIQLKSLIAELIESLDKYTSQLPRSIRDDSDRLLDIATTAENRAEREARHEIKDISARLEKNCAALRAFMTKGDFPDVEEMLTKVENFLKMLRSPPTSL